MGKQDLSRRAFLGRAAMAAAAPLILPRRALGGQGYTAPNDVINVGYIGVGRRAGQLLRLPEGARVAAVADADQRRVDARRKGFPEARGFADYREMLEMDSLDAVVIATPDHWHALNAVHAMQAGKDVYIEKPMSLTIADGRAIADAARAYDRVAQIGSQQRTMEACRRGCEFVRNGGLGEIKVVHAANYPSPWESDFPEQPVPEGLDWEAWLGPAAPHPYHIDLFLPRAGGKTDERGRPLGWISFRPFSGGEMTGWGTHGLDMVQWALGMDHTGPVAVWPEQPGLEGEVRFRYANGVELRLDDGGPRGGARFVGELGEAVIDRGRFETRPHELAGDPLEGESSRDATDEHVAAWLDAVRERGETIVPAETGHRATTICHLGNIARWTGRELRWDPETERFDNDDEANALRARAMRAPWTLPEIQAATPA